MKIIVNNLIPFKGYEYFNFLGLILFTRNKNFKLTDEDVNHEDIHSLQMKYLLYIFFYILYGIEFIIKLTISVFCNTGKYSIVRYAYRSISFEQQAYYHENDLSYLENKKPYEWIKYIFKMYRLQ